MLESIITVINVDDKILNHRCNFIVIGPSVGKILGQRLYCLTED